MKIYLGADHRGFELKQTIKIWLEKHNILHEDFGAHELNKYDDYTLFAEKVASIVADNQSDFGLLICGSGVGVDIVANKFDGIRSAVGINPEQVQAARRDDDVNILVLAADYTSDRQAVQMLEKFITTQYEQNERRTRRLTEITKLEKNN